MIGPLVATPFNGGPASWMDDILLKLKRNNFIEKIFETFSRLNPKDDYDGTGLGLSLCRKIVERHHGVIHAEGVKNEGASFTIEIPQ